MRFTLNEEELGLMGHADTGLVVAAAQMGPVEPGERRELVVQRLVGLLHRAADRGVQLLVYPEAVLTAFFPHWLVTDEAELDGYFEDTFPGPELAPLLAAAAERRVSFAIGYAELVREEGKVRRFNTAVLVSPDGDILGRYRKVHLPGTFDSHPEHPFENLEKRYFDVGDLGWPTWEHRGARIGMCICNDRRWPETWRALGLQGAEIVLVGYNTPSHNPAYPESDRLASFHNHLSLQAGAYQNGTWVIGAAKAGVEAGVHQIGGSCIVAPSGEIIALAATEADELVTAEIDLAQARRSQQRLDLRGNRRPHLYRSLVE